MIRIKATVIFEISDEELMDSPELFDDDLPEKLKDETVKVKTGKYENLLVGIIKTTKVLEFDIPNKNLPPKDIRAILDGIMSRKRIN